MKAFIIRATCIFCTLSFTLNTAVATSDPGELATILSKHWEAMGGMANWSKVESIRLNGTIDRDGKVADIVIVKKRPNQIRATVTLPIPNSKAEKLQVIRAHDGQTAWTATRLAGAPEMQQEELPPEAAAELLSDAGVLPPLIKLWQEGEELKLLKPTIIQNESAFAIQATPINTNVIHTFYVSSEHFKLLGYDSIAASGSINRTTLHNYKNESGIFLPTKSITESTGTGLSIMSTESIKVGVGIYGDYFRTEPLAETAQID